MQGVQEVPKCPSEGVAQRPRLRIRVLPLQQRLLSSTVYSAVQSCEQEAQDTSDFASLGWRAGSFLQAALDKVFGLQADLLVA